jgi:acetyl esterase
VEIETSRFQPDLRPFSIGLPIGESLDLARRRAEYSIPELRWDPEIKIRNETIAHGGRSVDIRIYEPIGRPMSGALLQIHGGGFILGDLDVGHRRCLNLARNAGCLVVGVDYRLAPEHQFPAGLDDCFFALTWLHESTGELAVDPARIGVVGDSAGGCLAAAVALRARDEGGPSLAVQLLAYPVLDCRLETASIRTYWDGPGFSGSNADEMWKLYAPHLPEHFAEYASPSLAPDLSGLPPTYLSIAEFDPLRDEGIQYAQRLLDADVSVELRTFPGTWHGFDLDAPDSTSTQEFYRAEADAARRYLSPTIGEDRALYLGYLARDHRIDGRSAGGVETWTKS